MTEDKKDELDAIEEEIEEGTVETVEAQSDAREDAELPETPQNYGSPEEVTAENVYTFLKRAVFETPETFKVGNLKQPELGQPQIPVRTWLNIALSFKMRKRLGLNQYCRDKANILTDTSLSRDATALKLAVTQKKEVTRVRTRHPQEETK
jgi:hypothetical protein